MSADWWHGARHRTALHQTAHYCPQASSAECTGRARHQDLLTARDGAGFDQAQAVSDFHSTLASNAAAAA